MLQQTQVSVVMPYYERWMARFPSVGSLAAATEEEALQLWQGLGYYRRAKSLLSGAKHVVEHGFPSEVIGWKKVPGVGDYTAGAICSIAYNLAVPLVDGNVERVYARLNGDRSSGPDLSKAAWRWAEENVAPSAPGDWNQGLMELGATVCTPREPSCSACPIKLNCRAFLRGLTNELPVASPKPEIKRLNQTMWVLICDGQIHLTHSVAGEWWAGMYLLPTVDEQPTEGWVEDLGRLTYSITNHRIKADVKLVRLESAMEGYVLHPLDAIQSLPIPAPHRKALALYQRI